MNTFAFSCEKFSFSDAKTKFVEKKDNKTIILQSKYIFFFLILPNYLIDL